MSFELAAPSWISAPTACMNLTLTKSGNKTPAKISTDQQKDALPMSQIHTNAEMFMQDGLCVCSTTNITLKESNLSEKKCIKQIFSLVCYDIEFTCHH